MDEQEILVIEYSNLVLKDRRLVDKFIIDIGSICVKSCGCKTIEIAYDKVKIHAAQRSDWICLRKYRNENSNMDDYGLSYIKDNCAGKYLAYLSICLLLDVADKSDEKNIIHNYLSIGKLLDEYLITIKKGVHLDDLLNQMAVKKNYYYLFDTLQNIICSINKNNKIYMNKKLNEFFVVLETVVRV